MSAYAPHRVRFPLSFDAFVRVPLHSVSLDMQHYEYEPPEALTGTLKCFWYNRIESEEELQPFEVMPDGYPEIIFHFGSLARVSSHGDLQPLPSPFLVGLMSSPALFYTKNLLELIGVRCFPWTVFDLLGVESGKRDVPLLKHPIARLQPGLAKHVGAGRTAEALALIERYFLQTRTAVPTGSIVHKAGAALTEAHGVVRVSEVAAAAHATVRTLERTFKRSSGHSVKDVSSLMRFEQARNHLWLYPDSNLAGLAFELGYTDQSHLTREFKRYSGMTPAGFAKKRKTDHGM